MTAVIGDLVKKTQGYGAECDFLGIVVGIEKGVSSVFGREIIKLVVMTDDGIESWISTLCTVVSI